MTCKLLLMFQWLLQCTSISDVGYNIPDNQEDTGYRIDILFLEDVPTSNFQLPVKVRSSSSWNKLF